MHQTRATLRSSKRARSTCAAVTPASRARTPRAAAPASWACNPATRRTVSATESPPSRSGPPRRWARTRRRRAKSGGRVRGTAKRSRMTSLQASRTLVKSPPELWAELSELESLARHLGEFGEIRITKVDPESRVEWEADRARGTVRLEPSGWGTRVVLTVDTPEAAPEVVPPEPEPEPVAIEPEPEPEPEPVVVDPDPDPEPEPEPEPEPVVAPAPARRRRVRRGWFARLFRRTPPPPAP